MVRGLSLSVLLLTSAPADRREGPREVLPVLLACCPFLLRAAPSPTFPAISSHEACRGCSRHKREWNEGGLPPITRLCELGLTPGFLPRSSPSCHLTCRKAQGRACVGPVWGISSQPGFPLLLSSSRQGRRGGRERQVSALELENTFLGPQASFDQDAAPKERFSES